jgi:uncharacterized membrane protein
LLSDTAIVFSLAFVMVQFSSTAYSRRLVLWLSRDPIIWHAMGIFTATFLFALVALGWVTGMVLVMRPFSRHGRSLSCSPPVFWS